MKPGDILYSSWGYDQTNIDFYQVVKITNNFATIIELEQNIQYDPATMTGSCTPTPGQFRAGSKPIRRKIHTVAGYEPFLIVKSYAYANPWDGTPKHFSTYT
jgi:hypothetical protein